MGLLFFIALNVMLAVGLVALVRKPSTLRTFWHEFVRHPLIFTYQLIFIGACFLAGWGLLSGGKFSWRVPTPWGHIDSWILAAIIAICCLVVGFVYSQYEFHARQRRERR
jgi:hypothetical protein